MQTKDQPTMVAVGQPYPHPIKVPEGVVFELLRHNQSVILISLPRISDLERRYLMRERIMLKMITTEAGNINIAMRCGKCDSEKKSLFMDSTFDASAIPDGEFYDFGAQDGLNDKSRMAVSIIVLDPAANNRVEVIRFGAFYPEFSRELFLLAKAQRAPDFDKAYSDAEAFKLIDKYSSRDLFTKKVSNTELVTLFGE